LDRIWEMQDYNEGIAVEIHQELGVSMVTARLLAQRGVTGAKEADVFLNAGLDCLVDPGVMKGMTRAVERIRQAIERREKVVIYGDYDVDGVCSIVLLKDCLTRLGCRVDYYVPNRFSEGYGLNEESIEKLARQGCQLLITVDCGISSVEETASAMQLGMDVIITDHHTPPPILPAAWAVINPKNDDIKAIANLAGVGVAFKLAWELGKEQLTDEEMYEWLDLVALATVADIVPLLDENRILVKYGLIALGKTQRQGLRALIRECGLEGKSIHSWHVGYMLAPRLNSAGRLASARDSIDLLESRHEEDALARAMLLGRMNDERRIIEEGIFLEAVQQIENEVRLENEQVLIIGGEGWHQGVIGIVASRLAELYHRPAIVISWDGNRGKGSARSIIGFDLHDALSHAATCLQQFGGHKMAAGLSIDRQQIDNFRIILSHYRAIDTIGKERSKRHRIDMEIEEDEIQAQLLEELELLRPFGEGNPVPYFVMRASSIKKPQRIGKNKEHLKFKIGADDIEAIAFNLESMSGHPLQPCNQDIIFEMDVNEFRGQRTMQLKIKDFKSSFISDMFGESHNKPPAFSQIIGRSVEELSKQRSVAFVYPTVRCLLKHQGMLEHYFHRQNIRFLHGHLWPEERHQAQQEFAAGVSRVFLITESFLQYFQHTFGSPVGLGYMVWMWPQDVVGQGLPDICRGEICTLPHDDYGFIPAQDIAVQGKVMLYANRSKTVSLLQNEYPGLLIEAGVNDMKKRRAARRGFMAIENGRLLSDGTHTAGGPCISDIDGVILADSPFGRYELAAFTNCFSASHNNKLGVAFDKRSLQLNRSYLNRIYPESTILQTLIQYCLQDRHRLEKEDVDKMADRLGQHFNRRYSRMEILAVMRIMADLGLCRFEKSGSIMAINSTGTANKSFDICKSPYYLEGLAEKQILADWEMELIKYLVW